MGRNSRNGSRPSKLTLGDKLSRLIYTLFTGKRQVKRKTDKPLISGQYEIQGFICDGSFGKVMQAINIHTKLVVAAKLELMDSQFPQLPTEYRVYEILGCTIPGFIKVYHFGPCDRIYNALVMELLGPDLDDLFELCNFTFSYKTVLCITMQTLKLIKYVHQKGILYRDIKPENFCIGQKLQNTEKVIHIIDFGLSKVLDPNFPRASSQPHIDYDYLIGTARYMSINAHCGVEQSKRDDLESLGYMYMYFLNGKLPWMGLSRTKDIKNHYKTIAGCKASICLEKELKKYPEYLQYMTYVKKLEFDMEPDYTYLINLIKQKFLEMNYDEDDEYDWTPLMNARYLERALTLDPDDL